MNKMKPDFQSDIEHLETREITTKGIRISQHGKQQIENAEKIIIVEANAYHGNILNRDKNEDINVALAVDSLGNHSVVRSRYSNWYFEDLTKAIRTIRRLNQTAEIISMHEAQYQEYIRNIKEDHKTLINKLFPQKEVETKVKLKKSTIILHVNYNNGVFEVGFYTHEQINKKNDAQLITNTEPEPQFKVEFKPVNQFKTLEEAEDYVMKENILSVLRSNTDDLLKAFVAEQNEKDAKEMLKYAEDFERDQQQN